MRILVKYLALILNSLFVIAYILGCVTIYVAPDKFSGIAFLGTIFPVILVINIGFLLFWLVTRKWLPAIVLVLMFAFTFQAIRGVFFFPLSKHKLEPTERSLSLLTYNISNFGGYKEVNSVCDYIFEQDADIVCLQEFAIRLKNEHQDPDSILSAFARHYPYRMLWYKNQKGPNWWGVAIFSKYPLIRKHKVEYESLYNVSVQADVLFGTDTIRLFNNHLESNKLTLSDMKQFKGWQEGDNSQSIIDLTELLTGKLVRASEIRALQARVLSDSIQASPYPVIVCGDFNDVPQSYTYHLIRNNLRDAFFDAGNWGYGYTYHHHAMYVRIDHVLISPQFKAVSAKIDRPKYSDHYPLMTRIFVPDSLEYTKNVN